MTSPNSRASHAVEISFCEALARASASHLARLLVCLSPSSLRRASRMVFLFPSLPRISRQSRISSGTATDVSADIGKSIACNAWKSLAQEWTSMSLMEILMIFNPGEVIYSQARVCLLTVVNEPKRSPTSRARRTSAFCSNSRAPSVASKGCVVGKLKRAPLSTTGIDKSSANSVKEAIDFGLRPKVSAIMIGACALTKSSAALRSDSGFACVGPAERTD